MNTRSSQMGIHDEIGDNVFNKGMLADAPNLGDRVDREWIDEFKQEIHGVFLVTGDEQTTVQEKLGAIKDIFSRGGKDATIHEVLSVVGNARPGALSAHEQFVPCRLLRNLATADDIGQFRLPRQHLAANNSGGGY